MTAIIFDTETNRMKEPEIIEAAWLYVAFGSPTRQLLGEGGRDVPTVERFKPQNPIELGAMSTHHIMDEDLVNCRPSISFTLPPCDFLIGYNIDFDWEAAGKPSAPRRICLLAIARTLWPQLDCHSQSAMIYHLDRANARERLKQAHGAGPDTLLCKTILDAIIRATACESWEQLHEISEEYRIPRTMPFGKHKGEQIDDLPRDYISWMLKQPDIDEYLRKALNGAGGQRELF